MVLYEGVEEGVVGVVVGLVLLFVYGVSGIEEEE